MCLQATVRLAVLRPEDVVRSVDCEPAVAAATSQVFVPFQDGTVLECPNLQDATRMADGEPSVKWLYVNPGRVRPRTRPGPEPDPYPDSHPELEPECVLFVVQQRCETYPFWKDHQQQDGTRLLFHTFYEQDQGFYYCTVQFHRAGQTFNFTRRINVTAVCELPPVRPRPPHPQVSEPLCPSSPAHHA